jgi:hypothetical protein
VIPVPLFARRNLARMVVPQPLVTVTSSAVHGLPSTTLTLTGPARAFVPSRHSETGQVAPAPPATGVVSPGAPGSGGGTSANGASGAFFFLTAAVLAGIGLVPPLLRRRLRLADELGAPPAFLLLLERPG